MINCSVFHDPSSVGLAVCGFVVNHSYYLVNEKSSEHMIYDISMNTGLPTGIHHLKGQNFPIWELQ